MVGAGERPEASRDLVLGRVAPDAEDVVVVDYLTD
jgi:hypothetical protein